MKWILSRLMNLISPFKAFPLSLISGLTGLMMGTVPLHAATPAEMGSVSGQILKNNPMLNNPSPRNSEKSETLSLPENTPRPEDENAGAQIEVKLIRVIHVPEVARNEVEKLVADYRNRKMTLNSLRNVAINITSLLQAHGERLSYAYIPDQKITGGVVTIDVMQGRIESIRIHKNSSLVKDSVLNRYVKQMYEFKEQIARVENSLGNVTNLPGVGELTPYLQAGQEPGGSALWLDVTPARRVEGMVVVDNMGSLSSGRTRFGVQANINSPLGLGDRLEALGYAAPDFLQTTNDSNHGNTLIGRLAWDAPVGVRGGRLGLSFSRVSYKLGGPSLRGLGDGYADIASLYGSYPLLRGRRNNLSLGMNIDFKRMNDNFWDMSNRRHAPVFSLPVNGDSQGSLLGKPFILQYGLSPALGVLSNSDEWNGSDTRGRYAVLTESFNYLQGLYPGITLGLNFSGQQASKNLDGAEKMSLGGAYAVRAYSNSAASIDSGFVISPSLNLDVPGMDNTSFQLFYDYGRGKLQKFSAVNQTVALKGYGVGINYNFKTRAFINASYAWRQGRDELVTVQNKATGWITAGIRF